MTNSNENAISKTVVCFMFDGTPKYATMTLNAINSFINTTPKIAVGLLVPAAMDTKPYRSLISDPSRVHFRTYESHFENWNPTQYKLDIQKFSDEFESIWWLDSDAIVYKNLTDVLVEFYESPCKVAFLRDHVCFNKEFLASWYEWRQVNEPFVPQACFMGFKKSAIHDFFTKWQAEWKQWIEPTVFMNRPNPLPSFPSSAFCVEQYSQAVVLESVPTSDIFVIQRITFPLRGISAQSPEFLAIQNTSFSGSFNFGSFSMTNDQLNENQMRLLTNSFSSFNVGSFSSGSFSGASASYGGVNFGGASSAQFFSGPYVEFSGPMFSGQVFSGPFVTVGGSFSGGSFSGSSFSGALGSFSGAQSSFTTSWGGAQTSFSSFATGVASSSAGAADLSSFSGGSFSTSFPGIFVPVDNIAGGIVHFYSAFYEQSYKWWEEHKTEVIPRLGEFWESK